MGRLDDAESDVTEIRSIKKKFGRGDFYNLACVYSISSSMVEGGDEGSEPSNLRKGYREKAIESLRQSLAAGWKHFAHIREDSDLDPIRDHPEFKKLIEESKVDEEPVSSPAPDR